MVDEFFPALIDFFKRMILYFDYLLLSIGGAKYIVAAISIVLFVSFMLMPLRGRGLDVSSFTDYKISNISKRAESRKQKQQMDSARKSFYESGKKYYDSRRRF